MTILQQNPLPFSVVIRFRVISIPIENSQDFFIWQVYLEFLPFVGFFRERASCEEKVFLS